jgi:periplasmic copper chaperone A
MKRLFGLLLLCSSTVALAHVGVVNVQTPFAVAGKTYELVLAVPHGCAYTTTSGTEDSADTYKIEVSIPAGFVGVRPIIDGVFGKPRLAKDANGAVTTITWEKPAALDSTADDQSYRVALRSTAPSAPFTTAQFNVKQSCRNPAGGADLVVDWANYGTPATNQSPKVKIYPARAPGWNKYSIAANQEQHGAAAVKAFLADYFADAQIVWVAPGTHDGHGGYSASAETTTASYYAIADEAALMLHANEVLWVKF